MDYRARQRAPNATVCIVNQAKTNTRNQKQQQQQSSNSNVSSSSPSQGNSGSENEEQNPLSSLNSALSNTSSRQIMLAHHNNKIHHQQQQQQQHHIMQQQKRTQMAANRQAALQQAAHNLTVSTNKINHLSTSAAGNTSKQQQQQQIINSNSSGDNMTTSSSDHTLDDLQQLAHSYGHHRLHHHTNLAAKSNRYHHSSRQQFDDGISGSSAALQASSGDSQSGSRFLLGVLFTLAEILLFTVVLLWLYWSYQHDDGLAWQTERKQQFNTHAALMLVGFVFLNGQAILIYRSFQCCSKIYTKILHTILFVLATSAISLGLILGYTAQENVGPNNKPIMHFYSLHAWTGLATVGLFSLQFVFGFISFLILLCCDQATSKYRAALLPIHRTFGLIIFSLAIATCLMGLLQTARSRLR